MTDIDNRLSAVDLPGTTFRHSERRRREHCRPQPRRCSRKSRFRYVTSQDAGWTARPAATELPAVRAAAGRRMDRWRGREDRRQRGLRRVPQSVGVQRAAGARLDAAVLLCQERSRPRPMRFSRPSRYPLCCCAQRTARSAAARWTGISGPSTRRTTRFRSSGRSRRRRWSR